MPLLPYVPSCVICTVIGRLVGSLTNTSAISRSFQTQRNWKMANDASAGTDSGMTTRLKTRELGRAVHPRGLDQVSRQRDEEVAEQEDRERQPERGVGEPDPVEVR